MNAQEANALLQNARVRSETQQHAGVQYSDNIVIGSRKRRASASISIFDDVSANVSGCDDAEGDARAASDSDGEFFMNFNGDGGGGEDDDDIGSPPTLRGREIRRPPSARFAGEERDVDAADDDETPAWTRERRLVALETVGEQRLQKAEVKSVVRQYERVLAEPRTEEDVEYQVEHDEDALRWRTTKHPRYAAIDAALGQPAPRTECWGCMNGNHALSSVAAQRLDELQSLYKENRMEVDPAVLGGILERFYEKNIRTPANEAIRLSSTMMTATADLLPPWSAATIVDHFTNHRTEPQAKVSKRLDQVGALADQLFDGGLFRAPANAKESDVKPSDIRVSEKYARLFMSSVAMEMRLQASVPSRMFGYNADLNIDAKARPFVRSRHSMVDSIRAIRPFNAEPPQPL